MQIGTGALLLRAWTEPHRVYHSLGNHLLPLLERIEAAPFDFAGRLTLAEIAWWHDAVYVLGADDNEERSIELYCFTVPEPARSVIEAIAATKLHAPTGDRLTDWFLTADLGALATGDPVDLLRDEQLLFEEYSRHYSLEEYTRGRERFLTNMLSHPLAGDSPGLRALIAHVGTRMAPATAIPEPPR
jgi:predicted metal-dependent HD superfamily phosphohydrolase